MVVYKTYQYNGVDAFTILLKQSLVKGNTILSTLPQDFIVYYLKPSLQKTRNAYIPDEQFAHHHLDELAKKIVSIPNAEQLFFPPFVLFGKEVNESTIFKIISAQNNLHVWPNTHYCVFNLALDFYVMRSMYIVERVINNPRMVQVNLEEFIDYLVTEEMKLDYDRLYFPENKAYRITEDSELRYLLLVNKAEELLMVLSL